MDQQSSSLGRFHTYGSIVNVQQGMLDSRVIEIFRTDRNDPALKSDGSVVTWGSSLNGGDNSSVSTRISCS